MTNIEVRREALANKHDNLFKNVLEKPIDQASGLAQAEERLKEFRQVCHDLVLCDILYAKTKAVETQLWTAHSRINALFRKQLAVLRKGAVGPVELHKFIKHFLSFLKDSQRFYRQFIQGLNAQYGAIPELQQIAQLEPAESKPLTAQSPQIRRETLLSCHRSLIYLGDLSRYRATEKLDQDSVWGPAVGYYTLAATLRPASGMAYHQLSVIALEESDHLRAIYYLYRAIVVDEPHPIALNNLELEFKKVRRAWDTGVDLRKGATTNDSNGLRKVLSVWFVRLHCLSFQGKRTPVHAELENEVQSQLTRQLKTGATDAIISKKMCYINFAAQKTAADRFEAQPSNPDFLQSYFFFLENNVRTIATLLDCVTSALKEQQVATDCVSTVLQSILPLLRLYSAWLLTNAKILVSNIGDEYINTELSKFWTNYADVMTLLSATFPVESLPEANYQLPEDIESFAFKPLESQHSLRLWYDGENRLPECTKLGDKRLDRPKEDLARIRGLLIDGLLLAVGPDDPLMFDGIKFVVKANIVNGPAAPLPQVRRPPPGLERQAASSPAFPVQERLAPAPAQREQEAVRRMSEMVDELVGIDQDDAASSRQHTDTLARRLSTLNTTPSQRPGSADSLHRMQSVSSLWGYESPLQPNTPNNESSQRTLGHGSRGHSRVNSASSFHSMGSGQVAALASSFVPTPPTQASQHPGRLSTDLGPSRLGNSALSGYDSGSGMNSPLLFGTGGVWSARPRRSIQDDTPPAGQGG